MGWLSIIMMIIQYGPAIYKLVKELIELIKKARKADQPALKAELKEAAEHYKKTKDKTVLERLRDRLHKECYGVCYPKKGA